MIDAITRVLMIKFLMMEDEEGIEMIGWE